MKGLSFLLGAVILTGCVTLPRGVAPVDTFDLDRYLGTWYEIARLDHRFERGLSHVSATYSKRADGGVDVVNRGRNIKTGQWQEAKGRAYFVGSPDIAQLKVTFFWPFYGGYNVIELDRDKYSYALVCGPNKSYFWLLARTPQLEESLTAELVKKATAMGFNTDQLIFVDQGE